MSNDYKKNIGYIGTLSLLVSSITGPGLLTVPAIWQQGGWLYPILFHIFITVMSGLGGLFLLESISKFPNNNEFTENVEMTVLVHQFYDRRWHIIMQIFVYGAMQSTNIASIVLTAQAFDNMFIALGGTCGVALAPISGIICVTSTPTTVSIFGDGQYMLITLGYFVMLVLTIPLSAIDLADNMIVQFVSFVSVQLITVTWFIGFCTAGLANYPLPAIGSNTSQIVGSLLFNYAFATTVPSWLNGKHKSVPTKKSIWVSLAIATSLYIIIGLFGSLSFDWSSGGTILAILSASPEGGPDTTLNLFMFPLTCLVTSIPVYIIISRQNLVQANVCSNSWANFWAFGLPLMISVPLQNGDMINTLVNWTSLIFTSSVNFIAPFLIHYFAEHRNTVLSESIMSELSFGDDDVKSIQRASGPDPYDGYHLKLDTVEVTKKSKWTGAKFRLRTQLANRLKNAMSASGSKNKSETQSSIGEVPEAGEFRTGEIRESAMLNDSQVSDPTPRSGRSSFLGMFPVPAENNRTSSPPDVSQDTTMAPPIASSPALLASGIPVAKSRVHKFTMQDITMAALSQLHKTNKVAPSDPASETVQIPNIVPAQIPPVFDISTKDEQASSLRSRSAASGHSSLISKGRSDRRSDENIPEDINDKYEEFTALPNWITDRIPAKYVSLCCAAIMSGITILVLILQATEAAS